MRSIRNRFMLSLLLLTAIIAGAVVLSQEVLRVHAVVVVGCVERPADEVTALSGILMDESIFKVDLAQVRRNVERSPYYRVEKVERLYPGKIGIQVHERRPRAIVQYLGASIVMDEAGFILEVRPDLGSVRCPVVTGLRITTFNVGQLLETSESVQLHVMQEILEALERQGAAQLISEIALENPLDVRLMTVEGFSVSVGDIEGLDNKFVWLQAVLPQLHAMGAVGGTIYLTGKSAGYAPPRQDGGDAQMIDVWGGSSPAPEGQDIPQEGGEDAPEEGEEQP